MMNKSSPINTKNYNKSIDVYKQTDHHSFKSYERFHFLLNKMSSKMKSAKTLLDIGCSKGEFIYLLKEQFPKIKYTGIEYSRELITLAKKESFLKDVEFIHGDAQSFNLKRKFDITVMSGLLPLFDHFEIPLRRMIQHTKPGGTGYIFNFFNKNDMDIIVRFRNNHAGSTSWESGFNTFSIKTIKTMLKKHVKKITIDRFEIGINLPKKENPVSSFTLNTKEMGRIILNGANIYTDYYLIKFQK